MIRVPAHKQRDPAKAPGVIKTIGDYIQQKTAGDPKKLTFKEWALKTYPNGLGIRDRTQAWSLMQAAWEAGQANV